MLFTESKVENQFQEKDKMVSIDNIFGLFSHDDRDLSNGGSTTYVDFKTTPKYYLGMYKKLILNHINFNKKVLQFFKNSNADLELDDMKEAGEFVTYNRAWTHIRKIEIENNTHTDAIEFYSDEYLTTALELGINYFQGLEEYEKCAFLLKIKEKSEEFQSKVGVQK